MPPFLQEQKASLTEKEIFLIAKETSTTTKESQEPEENNLTARKADAAPVLHIASAIAHVRPEYLHSIKNWLSHLSCAEIHAENDQGKLVVVIEAESERKILDVLDGLVAQPGTLGAALVYHEILTGEPELP